MTIMYHNPPLIDLTNIILDLCSDPIHAKSKLVFSSTVAVSIQVPSICLFSFTYIFHSAFLLRFHFRIHGILVFAFGYKLLQVRFRRNPNQNTSHVAEPGC